MELSVVIPVYNSEKSLEKVVLNLEKHLINLEYEIIFVDDYSKDNSYSVLKEISKFNKHIKVIKLNKNCGQQNAIFAGLYYCSGEYIVTMDDDLQHDSKDILHLIKHLDEGYDLVYGIDEKNLKNNGPKGAQIRDIFFKYNFPKLKNIKVSSFRGFKRELLGKILKIEYKFIYLSAILLAQTDKIANFNTHKKERIYGISNYSFFMRVKLFSKLVFYYSKLSVFESIKPKGIQFEIEKVEGI